jgi:deoxyhypusine synthase
MFFLLCSLKQGEGDVVVEMEDDAAGPVRAARLGEIAVTAKQSFEEVAAGVRPIVETILSHLRDLGPEAVTIEFGIKFGTEAGVILAKAAAEGTCKVTFTWKPSADS